jgi:hypothetical protein
VTLTARSSGGQVARSSIYVGNLPPSTAPAQSTELPQLTVPLGQPSSTGFPVQVTYGFGGAVKEVTPGDATHSTVVSYDSSIPAGTATLSLDGAQVCSAAVGGTTETSNCTVTFTTSGNHVLALSYATAEGTSTGTVEVTLSSAGAVTQVGPTSGVETKSTS